MHPLYDVPHEGYMIYWPRPTEGTGGCGAPGTVQPEQTEFFQRLAITNYHVWILSLRKHPHKPGTIKFRSNHPIHFPHNRLPSKSQARPHDTPQRRPGS